MSSLKQDILDRVDIKNKVGLSHLISNSMITHRMLNSMELVTPSYEFRTAKFLKGLKPILNEIPSKQATITAVEILQTVFDVFGIETSKEECFILYMLRDLGKFKMKDSKLLSDLQSEWGAHPDYRVEKDEFKQILRELKNIKLIDVRRGSVMLSDHIMLS